MEGDCVMSESGSLLEFSIWESSHQVLNLRTSSLFHLLKGKRTTSVLFFALKHHLEKYFACLPELEKDKFENIISQMTSLGYLDVKEGKLYAKKQLALTEDLSIFSYKYLNGLSLMNNESLALIKEATILLVQIVSQTSFQEKKFSPTTNNSWVQQLCKSWLASRLKKDKVTFEQLCREIAKELWNFLDEEEPVFNVLFLSYFIGFQVAPATREQRMLLLNEQGMQDENYIDRISWVYFIQEMIDQKDIYPLFFSFLTYLIQRQGLSSKSSQESYLAFLHGSPISRIAKSRYLKESTVNDHLIELALIYPATVARRILFLGQPAENNKLIQAGLDIISREPNTSFDDFEKDLPLDSLRLPNFLVYRLSQIICIKEERERVSC